ncbi:MAG: hypothetical protein ACHQK9_16750, partial [Reyranellales bacterium]
MFRNNEETCSLTLRSVRRQTIDALYEGKALTGLPICQLVDEIVWRRVKDHPSMPQTRPDYLHENTCSLTLRRVRRQTIDALYELKALTGLPICRLVDDIVTDWVEKHPIMFQMRLEEVRRLAEEFGANDDTPSNP